MGEISMSGSMRAASFGWRLLYARHVGLVVIAAEQMLRLIV